MKKINKYYVGATHIGESLGNGVNDSHTCATIESAIEQAKEKLVAENLDAVIVVQIVRIIRRREQPIVIETVR